VDISPRRAKLGGLSRGMRSVDAPPPTPATAGGPVAGAQSAKVIANHVGCNIPHVSCVYQQVSGWYLEILCFDNGW
jgi:hypothetical protein